MRTSIYTWGKDLVVVGGGGCEGGESARATLIKVYRQADNTSNLTD